MTGAALPDNYVAAEVALRKALAAHRKRFPAAFAEARRALAACLLTDECAAWPDEKQAASYVRQAEDGTLVSLASRVTWKAWRHSLRLGIARSFAAHLLQEMFPGGKP